MYHSLINSSELLSCLQIIINSFKKIWKQISNPRVRFLCNKREGYCKLLRLATLCPCAPCGTSPAGASLGMCATLRRPASVPGSPRYPSFPPRSASRESANSGQSPSSLPRTRPDLKQEFYFTTAHNFPAFVSVTGFSLTPPAGGGGGGGYFPPP